MPLTSSDSDARHQVGLLEAANRSPISVTPDATLTTAVTQMLAHNYSQLPVVQNERHLKGAVSWKSIGARQALGTTCELVKDCMEDCPELKPEASIFEAIDVVAKHEFVVIRARDGRCTGIVTGTDLSEKFRDLTEPFLVLGEVERQLRRILEGRFSEEDLVVAKDPLDQKRVIKSVADLSFGEYERLFQAPSAWEKLGLRLDRAAFAEQLHAVRIIRNRVMHFAPDRLPDPDMARLRKFNNFLHEVDRIAKQAAEKV